MKTNKSFYRWMLSHANENNPMGDLAKDIRADYTFPRKVKTYSECLKFLNSEHPQAVSGALNTLRMAWSEYAKERATHILEDRKFKILKNVGTV